MLSRLESIEWEMDTIEKEIASTERKAKALTAQLRELQEEKEKLDWRYGADEQKFGGLTIEANYGSWVTSKSNHEENVFYIETEDSHGNEMTIEDAKDLVKYLQQKIDYLEEK